MFIHFFKVILHGLDSVHQLHLEVFKVRLNECHVAGRQDKHVDGQDDDEPCPHFIDCVEQQFTDDEDGQEQSDEDKKRFNVVNLENCVIEPGILRAVHVGQKRVDF